MTLGVGKIEWCGYPMVKKLKISLFVLRECTDVTDGQTDGHRMTASAAFMHSIAQQKPMHYFL